jgi:hypothetical protein
MHAHDAGAAAEQLTNASACEVVIEISPIPEEVAADVRVVLARVLVAQALRELAHSPIMDDVGPPYTTMVGSEACHAGIEASP